MFPCSISPQAQVRVIVTLVSLSSNLNSIALCPSFSLLKFELNYFMVFPFLSSPWAQTWLLYGPSLSFLSLSLNVPWSFPLSLLLELNLNYCCPFSLPPFLELNSNYCCFGLSPLSLWTRTQVLHGLSFYLFSYNLTQIAITLVFFLLFFELKLKCYLVLPSLSYPQARATLIFLSFLSLSSMLP